MYSGREGSSYVGVRHAAQLIAVVKLTYTKRDHVVVTGHIEYNKVLVMVG